MKNPLPCLPQRIMKIIKQLKKSKLPAKLLFIIIGLLSTFWFLIRVIPKPSRAYYPCMRATAPFMSSFVIWILSVGGSTLAFKSFRQSLSQSKYLIAVIMLLTASVFYLISFTSLMDTSQAKSTLMVKGSFPPNQPIGEAKGIFPGRVVWMWDPDATNENCSNTSNNNGIIDSLDDAWFMEKNNNYQVIDSMFSKSILTITGTEQLEEAWHVVFQFYNEQNGNGLIGYTPDEKILIKINATTAYGGVAGGRYDEQLSRTDDLEINPFSAETNPWLILVLLHSLVDEAGVPQEMIYLGDPARNIYKEFYSLWHDQFPDINYLGNNLIHPEIDLNEIGRHAVEKTASDRVFFSDFGTSMPDAVSDKLFTIFDEIDYLINVPTLKAHATGGITLAAKNHFGSFTRTWAMHLHPGLMDGIDDPSRLGYGLYRVQTDIMMHKLLGGKNLLMLVDGLYPGEDALGVPEKWQMSPYNDGWCSSIFVSLDPVAIESVCHDFLRTEYNGPTIAESRPNWDGVDDYLHQAADQNLWPDGLIYNPDNDDIIISSLGVHEHWNNESEMAYSRNLGIDTGIELIKAHEYTIGLTEDQPLQVSYYPNPVSDVIRINNQENMILYYNIIDNSGKIVRTGSVMANTEHQLELSDLLSGTYIIKITNYKKQRNLVFIKI